VRICSVCDHGQIYCPPCGPERHKASRRRARQAYRRTPRGRLKHRYSERRRRRRQAGLLPPVGDHGSARDLIVPRLSASSALFPAEAEVPYEQVQDEGVDELEIAAPIDDRTVPPPSPENALDLTADSAGTPPKSHATGGPARHYCSFCGAPGGDALRRGPLWASARAHRERARPS